MAASERKRLSVQISLLQIILDAARGRVGVAGEICSEMGPVKLV